MDDQPRSRSQSQAGLSQIGRCEDLPILNDGEAASPASSLWRTDDAGLVQECLLQQPAQDGRQLPYLRFAILGKPGSLDLASHNWINAGST